MMSAYATLTRRQAVRDPWPSRGLQFACARCEQDSRRRLADLPRRLGGPAPRHVDATDAVGAGDRARLAISSTSGIGTPLTAVGTPCSKAIST